MKNTPIHTSTSSKTEKGQALVLVVLSMMVLFGLLALLTDVGLAYAQRRGAQNGADAAATAAARLIALHGSGANDAEIRAEIDRYVQMHDVNIDYANTPPYYVDGNRNMLSPVGQGTVPGGTRGVSVTTSITFTTFFASIPMKEKTTMDVGAKALALAYQAKMPLVMNGLVPLAIPKNAIDTWHQLICWGSQYGQRYEIPTQFKGILDLGSGSGPGYEPGEACGNKNDCVIKWIAYGFDGTIGAQDWIPAYNGELGNNVKSNVTKRIYDQHLSDAGGAYGYLMIPVWDQELDGSLHIWGFAQVKVYVADIGPNMAPCKFVSFMAFDGSIDTGGWQDIGPKVVKLVGQ